MAILSMGTPYFSEICKDETKIMPFIKALLCNDGWFFTEKNIFFYFLLLEIFNVAVNLNGHWRFKAFVNHSMQLGRLEYSPLFRNRYSLHPSVLWELASAASEHQTPHLTLFSHTGALQRHIHCFMYCYIHHK